MCAYLPPPSLQLGQVQATLRSLFPSWCCWSPSSSTTCTLKCVRSLVFNVESPLSCHSSGSGSSSLILISKEITNTVISYEIKSNTRSLVIEKLKTVFSSNDYIYDIILMLGTKRCYERQIYSSL